jgi:plastocyanin
MRKWSRQIINKMAHVWTKWLKKTYLIFAVLFLTACSNPPEKQKEISTPKVIPQEVYTVEIKDMKFVPAEITVKKGDKVVFVNRDMVAHCVTEVTASKWTSSAIPSGEAYMLVVNESSNYYCAIHKVMKGKIILK